MKTIGQGFQYTVYDLGDKVLKKPTSLFHVVRKQLAIDTGLFFHPLKLYQRVKEALLIRQSSLDVLKRDGIDLALLANPVIKGKNIVQDKVLMFGQLLDQYPDRGEDYVAAYIENILEGWKYGFSDTVFNPTLNNGMDIRGRMVLADFGELTFDKTEVADAIKNKRWEKSSDFKLRLKEPLKSRYRDRMEKMLSLERLDENWKRNLKLERK